MQELSFRNDILPLKDKLFRLALRITFDRAEAEDVVQETLIRVWNKRDEWSQFGSIEAYCLTVARNLAIDRSERKDSRTVELLPEMEQVSDASSPYEKLVNKERMAINLRNTFSTAVKMTASRPWRRPTTVSTSQ